MPQSAISRGRRLVETEYMVLAVSLADLTGRKVSWEEIAQSLRRHRQRAALTFLSTLDAILENDGETPRDTQLRLARDLLPPDLLAGVTDRLRSPYTVVFSRQPVWILEKLVLLYANTDDNEASTTETEMRDLALLLLAIVDHLDEPDVAGGSDGERDDADWALLQHIIRASMLHTNEDFATNGITGVDVCGGLASPPCARRRTQSRP